MSVSNWTVQKRPINAFYLIVSFETSLGINKFTKLNLFVIRHGRFHFSLLHFVSNDLNPSCKNMVRKAMVFFRQRWVRCEVSLPCREEPETFLWTLILILFVRSVRFSRVSKCDFFNFRWQRLWFMLWSNFNTIM